MTPPGLRRITDLPLFPLPDAFLFPGALVPLHVFEPRYRQMVADLLDTAGRLALGCLDPAGSPTPRGPAVLPFAGLGEIVSHRRLDDGRYLIWLLGLDRLSIEEAPSDRLYRRVHAEVLDDVPGEPQSDAALVPRLRDAVASRMLPGVELSSGLDTGLLADLLFQHLPLSRERKAWAMAERHVTRRAEAALTWLDGLADAAEA